MIPLVCIAIVVIRDSSGRLFVHRRRDDKKVYPGLYGLGAGGRVEPGEEVLDGARRELQEETGLQTELAPVTSFDFVNEGFPYEVHVFQTGWDGPIENHAREWQWSGWMEPAQVEALAVAGSLCTDTAEAYRRLLRGQATRP